MKTNNNDSTQFYMSYLVSLYMNDTGTNKMQEADGECNLEANNHKSKN